jgi:hypothetical protein
MKRERIKKIPNYDEKLRSFSKDCIVELFVNDEGLLDIKKSNAVMSKWERPFKDDPDFDMFTDKEMKHAQRLIGNQQTFVTFRGLPFDGLKQKYFKTLMLIDNPPATLLGRSIAGYRDFDDA